jgi:hypothetical protein
MTTPESPTVSRIPVPQIPNGRIQRAIPAPFARPSITVGGASVGVPRRVWRNVAAHAVKAGDIVANFGRVTAVDDQVHAPAYRSGLTAAQIADELTWVIALTGTDVGNGTPSLHLHGAATVYAFVTEEQR